VHMRLASRRPVSGCRQECAVSRPEAVQIEGELAVVNDGRERLADTLGQAGAAPQGREAQSDDGGPPIGPQARRDVPVPPRRTRG